MYIHTRQRRRQRSDVGRVEGEERVGDSGIIQWIHDSVRVSIFFRPGTGSSQPRLKKFLCPPNK
jgi:hypothetical protein